MYPTVLNKNQSRIITTLEFLERTGFYLAGGTGLALQIGHRTSLDFDFYTPRGFIADQVLPEFQKRFKGFFVRRAIENTLILTANQTDLSFFYYPYKLIEPFVKYKSVNLASIEDIAAMKIAAITQRGKRRDFIDIYYLLQKFPLEKIIKFTLKKYPGYQQLMILRGLIYFEDAEEEELERGIKVLNKDFSWEKAKKKIFAEVKKYQLGMIKKT